MRVRTAATNGPNVHPHVIYEHGVPWCNDIDRGELLTDSPKFSVNPTSSRLVAMQEELEKEMNFAL